MQDAIAMVIQTTYQTFNLGIDLVLLKDSRAVEYLGRRYYLVLYHSKKHISYRSFVCKSLHPTFIFEVYFLNLVLPVGVGEKRQGVTSCISGTLFALSACFACFRFGPV